MKIDHNTMILIWIIGGALIMAAEFLMPGMIIVFFGFAAILTGALNWLGLITSLKISLAFWIITSFLLVLVFRKTALKLFPAESRYQLIEEDVDAVGTVVTVLNTIEENGTGGRISYGGTSWQAVSNSGTIEEGKKARLLYRDNISWVVEPAEEDTD